VADDGPPYFLDTSALVKLYHEEPSSEVIEALAADLAVELSVSEVARVELHSALVRKRRDGQLTDTALQEALACFRDDAAHRFRVVPVAGVTFDAAIDLLLQHGTHVPLRTLDALQLAAAKAAGTPEPTFVTADAQLITVAARIFTRVMNPEVGAAPSR